MEELLADFQTIALKIADVYEVLKESAKNQEESINVLKKLHTLEDKIIDLLACKYDLWDVCASLDDLDLKSNVKKRMHNKLIMKLIRDNKDINYQECLTNWIVSDHLLVALAINEDNLPICINLNNVKYVIAYFAPMIEKELINNDFKVNCHPFIASDALMGLYNIPEEIHVMFKDAKLGELFNNYLEFFDNRSFDNEGMIITGYIIQSFLRSVMVLTSSHNLKEMQEIILNFLKDKSEEDIVYKILQGTIDNNDKDIPYKVTLKL